ncbi:DUF433 domain-containing protein [Kamptonema animale CS-326]|jgi:uncharacterized protein (DUF433 family)|uniref:DUF433 domain-containing protein n=1 Tax=Kamptonema animale TaxID=92934 RepID=UPI00232F6B56|nr:DUF433 domain-containing protein [Kamptonema animale]MDB9514185.1 DUF433 domain-containing protein [Kamptonema animale CS-326]
MSLRELKPKLQALTPAEKTEAIQILAQSLAWPGIEKTPGVCGGDARIAGTRIPVWLLAGYRCDGTSDAHILEGYPNLSQAELEKAWAYAEKYPDEIEAAIKRNEEA